MIRNTTIAFPYIIIIKRFSSVASEKYKNGLFPEIIKNNK